jgi:hypothetical protein
MLLPQVLHPSCHRITAIKSLHELTASMAREGGEVVAEHVVPLGLRLLAGDPEPNVRFNAAKVRNVRMCSIFFVLAVAMGQMFFLPSHNQFNPPPLSSLATFRGVVALKQQQRVHRKAPPRCQGVRRGHGRCS